MREAIRRWNTVPFETLFGCLAVFGGVIGLLHVGTSTDALDGVLGDPLVTTFQIVYILAGIFMLAGIGRGQAWLEAPGLILLVASVVVRALAVLILYGFDRNVIGLLALYVLVVYFSAVRLRSLYRGDVIVRNQP
jgi:hypothetical protein